MPSSQSGESKDTKQRRPDTPAIASSTLSTTPPCLEKKEHEQKQDAKNTAEERQLNNQSRESKNGVGVAHRIDLPPWDRAVDVICHSRHADCPRSTVLDAFQAARLLYDREMAPKISFFSDPESSQITGASSSQSNSGSNSGSNYLRLPYNARLLICQYILTDEKTHPTSSTRQTITLAPPSFSRDAWSPKTFISISTALAPLQPYVSISRDLRADILIALFSSHTFHAVFSPYTNSRLSPFATTWLFRYGCYMRSIILELDMTKLGHGPALEAVNMLPGTRHIEKLVGAFAESQMRRDQDQPLQELTLLCRRFYGKREIGFKTLEDLVTREETFGIHGAISPKSIQTDSPDNGSKMSSSPDSSMLYPIPAAMRRPSASSSTSSRRTSTSTVKPSGESTASFPTTGEEAEREDESPMRSLCVEYCPEYHFSICIPLLEVLRGRLSSLRVCGFGDKVTQLFVSVLFPPGARYAYRLAPSSGPWGRLPGQKRYIDVGQGNIVLDDQFLDMHAAAPWLCFQGPVMPPPPVLNPDKTLSLSSTISQEEKMAFANVASLAVASPSTTTSRASSRVGGAFVNGREKEKKKKLFVKLLDKCLLSGEKNRRVLSRETTASI